MPTLAGINPGNDLADPLATREAGLVSVNGEDDRFHQNALRLRDKGLRAEMGRKARILLEEESSVEKIARRILQRAAPQ